MENTDNVEEKDVKVGAFVSSLTRTNKEIKKDRAESITEDAQLVYKREIEDMRLNHKRLTRERENMLDLSPNNKDSLMLANEFDAKKFTEKDINIGIALRELEIKLEIAEKSYERLFGEALAK